VPLCHDLHGVPHVLFTVRADDFGEQHAGFPGGARDPGDAAAVAAAVRDARVELGLDDAFAPQILGLTSDCADVPRQGLRGFRGLKYETLDPSQCLHPTP
jgi:8-oxo-dGTP pyrophosphatase MutT (NUDIX family)